MQHFLNLEKLEDQSEFSKLGSEIETINQDIYWLKKFVIKMSAFFLHKKITPPASLSAHAVGE